MEGEAGRAAPDDDIAMVEHDAFEGIGTALSAELKDGGDAEGDRDDGLGKIVFIAVLMRRHFGANGVAINQARVGGKARKSG